MQKTHLKALIIKRLAEIAILKGIILSQEHYLTWTNKIIEDYMSGRIVDIKYGFQKLESTKAYGGLDYAIFFEGAKVNENIEIERAWSEVIYSAKIGGSSKITARAGKALNSLGGMTWLKESDPQKVSFVKRDFIEAYKNCPEPDDSSFNCHGLNVPMYLTARKPKELK